MDAAMSDNEIQLTSLWDLDCEDVPEEVGTELLRQAELRQAAIFQAALGMDQRAAVLAAGFIAASGALAAGSFALAQDHALIRVMGFVTSLLLGLSATLCGLACRPQKFRFPGMEPLDWGARPGYLLTAMPQLRLSQVARLQDHIAENERRQRANARLLLGGMIIAAGTVPAAVITAWWMGA